MGNWTGYYVCIYIYMYIGDMTGTEAYLFWVCLKITYVPRKAIWIGIMMVNHKSLSHFGVPSFQTNQNADWTGWELRAPANPPEKA